MEKRDGKVVLLVDGNDLVDKCNIVQATIRKAGFIELNHTAYSPDIVPSSYYPFSNLKKFLGGKNFSRDDETIDTVEDCLDKLD